MFVCACMYLFNDRDIEEDDLGATSVDDGGKLLTDELAGLHRQTHGHTDTQTGRHRDTGMCTANQQFMPCMPRINDITQNKNKHI